MQISKMHTTGHVCTGSRYIGKNRTIFLYARTRVPKLWWPATKAWKHPYLYCIWKSRKQLFRWIPGSSTTGEAVKKKTKQTQTNNEKQHSSLGPLVWWLLHLSKTKATRVQAVHSRWQWAWPSCMWRAPPRQLSQRQPKSDGQRVWSPGPRSPVLKCPAEHTSLGGHKDWDKHFPLPNMPCTYP